MYYSLLIVSTPPLFDDVSYTQHDDLGSSKFLGQVFNTPTNFAIHILHTIQCIDTLYPFIPLIHSPKTVFPFFPFLHCQLRQPLYVFSYSRHRDETRVHRHMQGASGPLVQTTQQTQRCQGQAREKPYQVLGEKTAGETLPGGGVDGVEDDDAQRRR